jgi:hypothetical protein
MILKLLLDKNGIDYNLIYNVYLKYHKNKISHKEYITVCMYIEEDIKKDTFNVEKTKSLLKKI